MNIDEIKKIALQYLNEGKIESDCIEYKKSHLQKDSLVKTMCAFANNLMCRELCMILIGVEEHNEPDLKGTPAMPICGYDEGQVETVENSLKSLTSFIKPKISYALTHTKIGGRAFVIFALSNNNNGPYEVLEKAEKDMSVNLKRGRYVRIERDSKLASLKEEFELLKKFSDYHFTEEYSNVATLDDLDVDYIREYLHESTNRTNTTALSKQEMAENMGLVDPNTMRVKNFALLMFSRNPEKFIPYSFIELIYRSPSGDSIMSSKEYRGPIWKQVKNILDDIKNKYLRSLTLRVKDDVKSETIYNYPYSTLEELITNAVVHKNYENPRTIQTYIYDESIVIVNYNKPIPPVTINDLNTKVAFPNRSYENPSIRDMFKSLDLIESFGSGIRRAKSAMINNGGGEIHFEEFDENVDITSVTVPINERFVTYSLKANRKETKVQNLDIDPEKLDIGTEKIRHSSKKLDIQGQKLDIDPEKLDIGTEKIRHSSKKLDIDPEKLDIGTEKIRHSSKKLDIGDEGLEIKLNEIDTLGIIRHSDYSETIKNALMEIYDHFFNSVFGRGDIVGYMGISNASGSIYIANFLKLNIIEAVKGMGKGKYRFK